MTLAPLFIGVVAGIVLILVIVFQELDRQRREAAGLPRRKYHSVVDEDIISVYDWSRKK